MDHVNRRGCLHEGFAQITVVVDQLLSVVKISR